MHTFCFSDFYIILRIEQFWLWHPTGPSSCVVVHLDLIVQWSFLNLAFCLFQKRLVRGCFSICFLFLCHLIILILIWIILTEYRFCIAVRCAAASITIDWRDVNVMIFVLSVQYWNSKCIREYKVQLVWANVLDF